jgi:hypothetical protein
VRRPRTNGALFAIVTAVALVGVSDGVAQDQVRLTWDQATAQVDFPVSRPMRTLGLEARVTTIFCDGSPGHRFVSAAYGRARGPGPSFFFYEDAPHICGNPDISKPVRRVRIRGSEATVSVFCPGFDCRGVGVADGRKHGWLLLWRLAGPRNTKRPSVQLIGRRMSLRALLRVARSFQRVDLDRPTIHVDGFRSPDGKTWCRLNSGRIAESRAWCVTEPAFPDPYPHHSGEVRRDGTVTTCFGTDASNLCTQNWDETAHRLNVGQHVELYGYKCTATAADAITCTVTGGAGNGRGFATDSAGVTAVGPP